MWVSANISIIQTPCGKLFSPLLGLSSELPFIYKTVECVRVGGGGGGQAEVWFGVMSFWVVMSLLCLEAIPV